MTNFDNMSNSAFNYCSRFNGDTDALLDLEKKCFMIDLNKRLEYDRDELLFCKLVHYYAIQMGV